MDTVPAGGAFAGDRQSCFKMGNEEKADEAETAALWIAFGYLSDAFRGFHSVMDEAHFGSFSQMLLLLLPAAVIALCVWMLHDNPKNQPENDSKEIPASGREKRAESGGKE